MKRFFLLFFCFLGLACSSQAAARFLVPGGDGNWTSITNWSATTGGASGASAPILGDAVTFDSASAATNITLDTSARACTSLAITSGYTGTMTFTNQLSVSGAITLGANMNFAGSGALLSIGGGTLTSSGKTLPQPFKLGSSATTTLADNWNVTGDVTVQALAANQTCNGFILSCNANLTFNQTTGSIGGTTVLRMAGTGIISQPGSLVNVGAIYSPVEINTAGTCTISGRLCMSGNGTGSFKYTAGTVSAAGSTLLCGVTVGTYTFTINATGLTLGSVKFNTGTFTLGGTEGFTMTDFESLSYTGSNIITMLVGKTYTITNSLVSTTIPAFHTTFRCITASSTSNINITSAATTALAYADFTDVAATGQTIYTYTGTLLRTSNVTTGSTIGNAANAGGGGGAFAK